jgi:uncharacterized membrane protein
MFGLEKYKYYFGKPGEGSHRYRFLNFAIVDVVATIVVVYIIHLLLTYFGFIVNFWILLAGMFILGIFLHRLFGVRTTIDKMFFKNVTN